MVRIDEWFVAFGEFQPQLHWWDIFTAPGWRHCYAFAPAGKQWIAVDPLSPRCFVVALEGGEVDEMIAGIRLQGFPILRMKPARLHSHRQIEPIYCVSVIKHLLGIRARWVLTPKQLHREMLKRGAVPAFV